MGKKFLVGLIIIVLLSLEVACSGPTASSHPRTATATPAIYVHTPPPHTDSPLVGVYTTTITRRDLVSHPEFMEPQPPRGGMNILGTWKLYLKSDGNYIALNGNYWSGEQYVGTGFYTVTQNHLNILTDAKCLEFYVPFIGPSAESAMYTWSLQKNILKLQAIRDLCPVRNMVFTLHPWVKES